MGNPIFDDDEDSATEADKAAAAKVKAKATAEPAADEQPQPDDAPVVQVSEEEEDDQPTRTEKKRNRYREAQERAEEAERQAEHYRQLYEGAKATPAAPAADPGKDPELQEVETKVSNVRRQQKTLYQEFIARGKNVTQEDINHYERENERLRDEEIALGYRRQRIIERPQEEQQRARETQQQFFKQRYGDIYEHARSAEALTYAEGVYKQNLVRERGRKPPQQILDEAMEAARRDVLKTGKRPPPSETTKRKFAGESAGPGGGGGEGQVVSVTMTKERRRMAESLYPSLPPEEAWKKWAKGPGKRLETRR